MKVKNPISAAQFDCQYDSGNRLRIIEHSISEIRITREYDNLETWTRYSRDAARTLAPQDAFQFEGPFSERIGSSIPSCRRSASFSARVAVLDSQP
jgi:hypothetical protein